MPFLFAMQLVIERVLFYFLEAARIIQDALTFEKPTLLYRHIVKKI